MKKIEKRKGIKILVIACALALVLTGITLLTGGQRGPGGVINTILSPGRSLMDTFAGWAEENYSDDSRIDELEQENAQLRQQITDMEQTYRDSETLLEENERLRELLGFSSMHRDFQLEPATILAWTSSSWVSEFTMSKGSESGVEAGDCVITETGALVGVVHESGVGWSTVRTLLDTEFSMGIHIQQTEETAVAEGDLELMKQGGLRLTYIPNGSEIKTGDTIVTSGLGGTHPSGLKIGSVATVSVDTSGLTDYAVIKPEVDFAGLSAVYVIKDFEIVE